MKFAYDNGADALALTDHGHMNGLPYQILYTKKLRADGKNFKPIFGVEAYFLPSLDLWRDEYEKAKQQKKKMGSNEVTLNIEDERASKQKVKDILKKRNHLILLAQNQQGLNNIFKLVSESYKSGNFYRYPRIDYDLLGNLFDRIYYYAVPDFIDLHLGNFHWFIFNVADIFITIGIIGLIFIELLKKEKTTKNV